MTRLVLTVAAVLGLAEFAPARAQYFGGPFYQSGYRSSFAYRSGFGFSFGGPNFRIQGFSGGFVTRSVVVAPPVFVTPVSYAPVGFGGPFPGGWGPGFGGFVPAAVAVPVPVPIPVVVGNVPDPNLEPAPVLPRNNGLFPQGVRPEDFLVIAPRRAAVPEVPRVADVRPPVIMFDPFKMPVRVEEPEADPKRESARLMKLGRASFAAGDFGRAAEYFERAATADPGEALPYFLQAQAHFASGQYADAAARIRNGLARDPTWPGATFSPVELYGGRPELFTKHLADLKKALTDNPRQVALEFVLGYQLWFSGEKVEADRLFRAAETRLPNPGPIALFKLP